MKTEWNCNCSSAFKNDSHYRKKKSETHEEKKKDQIEKRVQVNFHLFFLTLSASRAQKGWKNPRVHTIWHQSRI